MESKRDKCPCCGYLTLPHRIHSQMPQWDICILCNWEDDGQTDKDADKVYGGPNGSYSMSEARSNFKTYFVMYSPDNDTRCTPGEWPEEIKIKKSLIKLFEENRILADEGKKTQIWSEIINLENKLGEITNQRVKQYSEKLTDIDSNGTT